MNVIPLQTFPYGIYRSTSDQINGQQGDLIDGFIIFFQDDKGNDRFYACFTVSNKYVTKKEAFYNGRFELGQGEKVILQYFSTNGSWWIDGSRYGEINGTITTTDDKICLMYNQAPFYKSKNKPTDWAIVTTVLKNSMKDKGLL